MCSGLTRATPAPLHMPVLQLVGFGDRIHDAQHSWHSSVRLYFISLWCTLVCRQYAMMRAIHHKVLDSFHALLASFARTSVG